MKKYEITKKWLILPIIFLILFLVAIILIFIFLKNSSKMVKFLGMIVPLVLLILDVIYIIVEFSRPKIELKASKEGLFLNDDIIKHSDILNISTSSDIFSNIKIIIVLKNNEVYKIYHIKRAIDVTRELRVKYLKIYK